MDRTRIALLLLLIVATACAMSFDGGAALGCAVAAALAAVAGLAHELRGRAA